LSRLRAEPQVSFNDQAVGVELKPDQAPARLRQQFVLTLTLRTFDPIKLDLSAAST